MAAPPDWFYRQSSVLAFQPNAGDLEILLITSRRKRRWVLPKGVIELDLTPHESAAKEAFEEAGALGVVCCESLGEYEYAKWNGVCHVLVFPFRVIRLVDHWPEESLRTRQWFPRAEVERLVEEPGLRAIVQRFEGWFNGG